ncbi:ProQ/FINO family protein [Halomonas sp. E14]|uniref:ProQ/FINO family protein n=1 Tax=Halomonas sp. E14 TaxID=3397245 RepID=UPI00403E51D8
MIEERSCHLFSTLEARAAHALEALRTCREQLRQLEARLADAEAARLELMEENRELDEQNRELEEDNARLRERLRKGEPAPVFPGPARRAQGLSALMGHRPREEPAAQDDAPAPASQPEPAAAADKAAVTQHDERQASLAIEQAPSAEALLAQWYQRYPKAFFKGHTRPLQVGIHHALAAREPWPEKLVRRALAGYVNLPRYLKAVREGAVRIDLEGQPAGEVDAQAGEHARRKLEQLQGESRRGNGASGRKPGARAGRAHGGKPPRQAAAQDTQPGRPDAERAVGGDRPVVPAPVPASASVEPADPAARMEAKLSALLAKHGNRSPGD